MRHTVLVRKQFETRARVVIYFEASDVLRLTEAARRDGKLLPEYAREVLLGSIGTEKMPDRIKEIGNKVAGQLAQLREPLPESAQVENQVSSRTGHGPGCNCFQCTQTRRFFAPQKKKEEKPKKGRR